MGLRQGTVQGPERRGTVLPPGQGVPEGEHPLRQAGPGLPVIRPGRLDIHLD